MSYSKLQIMQEVQDKFVQRTIYNADLTRLTAQLEAVSTKLDAVMQNQAATTERLRGIEARLDKK
jgi:hypothetical protein